MYADKGLAEAKAHLSALRDAVQPPGTRPTPGFLLNYLLLDATCSAPHLVWLSRLVPTRTKNNTSPGAPHPLSRCPVSGANPYRRELALPEGALVLQCGWIPSRSTPFCWACLGSPCGFLETFFGLCDVFMRIKRFSWTTRPGGACTARRRGGSPRSEWFPSEPFAVEALHVAGAALA